MGYTRHVIKGISWVGSFRAATRIAAFAKTALLARILSPAQFGVYGIALLALAFLETITETGVNVILIQEKKTDEHINSAWIVSIVRGLLISFALIITAPFIAHFFNAPNSVNLLYLISTVPFLRGFINPSIIKLQKELQFNIEFKYKLAVFLLDTTIAVTASFLTRSPVGIIYGLIAGVLLEVALSYIVVRHHPRFLFDKKYLNNMFHKGKWVTASSIFNYLFHNADNIVVGRILGTVQLGFYQMAYAISIIPITEVADVFSKVVFPVYTRISDDRIRLKRAFLRTIAVTSLLTIPFGALIILFAKDIVYLALGDKWISIAPLLQVLVVFGVIRAISGTTSALFLGVGKQSYVTIVTFISMVGLIISIVPLVNNFSILGAAIAALIGSIVSLPFMFYFTIRLLKNYEKS